MNERIKALAEQAGFQKYFLGSGYICRDEQLERFAELVRDDERAVHALFAEKIQQDLNVYKTIIARFKQQLEQGSES